MGIKNNVLRLAAFHAAGFCLSGAKSIGTDDGYCWEATLCRGKRKLVTVSNGGYGGPDEVVIHVDAKNSDASIKADLAILYAAPVCVNFVRDHNIEMSRIDLRLERCTQEQFEATKARILAELPEMTEDALCMMVDDLRATKEEIARIKRQLKGKIAWLEKGKEDGDSYVSIKMEDTLANRKAIMEKYGQTIGVFLADLLVGV